MTFPATQAPVTVWLALGADLADDPSTWSWTEITADVRVADGITIEGGQRDEGNQVDATSCRLTLNNRAGTYSPRNPEGAHFGLLARNTPLRVQWDGTTRFVGYVSEWPTRWDITGNDSWVPLQASGVLRRLAQSGTITSALATRIPGQNPIAYWPMEDQAGDVIRSGSLTPGVRPMIVSGFDFGSDSELPGSLPLPTCGPGAAYSAFVPTGHGSTQFRVAFMLHMDTPTATNRIAFVLISGGRVAQWNIAVTASDILVTSYNEDGTQIFSRSQAATGLFGHWVRVYLQCQQNGSDVDWGLGWSPVDGSSGGAIVDTYSGAVGEVERVHLTARGAGADTMALGHLTVHDSAQDIYGDASAAYVGETALDRAERIAANVGVAWTSVGTDSATMGPQPLETPLGILRDCEAADGGLLYELDGGLAYLARSALYNQAVAVELDVASGHLGVPEPTDDDQQLVNDVTASRPNGSQFRYVDQDSVDRVGRYPTSVDANVNHDVALEDAASWRVHLGTVDAMRWPVLSVNLARNPDLIDAWLTTRPGSRFTVDHAIPQLPGIAIDVLVMGWSETITPYGYVLELNAVPASPWDVGVLDDDVLGRLDTDGTTLTDAATSSDTTLYVASEWDRPEWTQDSGELPFDVTVEGEQVTVTAIAHQLQDTFSRSVSSGWGTSDSGLAWVTNGGAASDYSTTGFEGRVSHTNVGTRRFTAAGDFADVEVMGTVEAPALATGGNIAGALVARYVNNLNLYMAQVVFTTAGTLQLAIFRRLASTFTQLGATVGADVLGSYTAAYRARIRFRLTGTTLRARMWQDNAPEPHVWQVVTTDSSFSSGAVGTHSVLLAGNTNTLPVAIDFDNLETPSLQQMTVTRSVNGVTKTHPAGADLRLAHPLVLAR